MEDLYDSEEEEEWDAKRLERIEKWKKQMKELKMKMHPTKDLRGVEFFLCDEMDYAECETCGESFRPGYEIHDRPYKPKNWKNYQASHCRTCTLKWYREEWEEKYAVELAIIERAVFLR